MESKSEKPTAPPSRLRRGKPRGDAARINRLERELQTTRERMVEMTLALEHRERLQVALLKVLSAVVREHGEIRVSYAALNKEQGCSLEILRPKEPDAELVIRLPSEPSEDVSTRVDTEAEHDEANQG